MCTFVITLFAAEWRLSTVDQHVVLHVLSSSKEAGAFEAPRQTKEELCANDTSRHPKAFKLGPEHGCQ